MVEVRTRTVNYAGMLLQTSQLVLDELDLKNGQAIDEGQASKIIRLNIAAFVAEIDLRKLAGETELPDTTDIQKKLSEVKKRCRIAWKETFPGQRTGNGDWHNMSQESILEGVIADCNRRYAGQIKHWMEYE